MKYSPIQTKYLIDKDLSRSLARLFEKQSKEFHVESNVTDEDFSLRVTIVDHQFNITYNVSRRKSGKFDFIDFNDKVVKVPNIEVINAMSHRWKFMEGLYDIVCAKYSYMMK